jgi:dTDP-4-dehydrorhamnose 3,5-epimerase
MAYVSVTRPGMSRGPHEHLQQSDMFCFVGPGEFELQLWDNRPESPTFGNTQELRAGEKDPIVLVIPPGVVHAYKNVGGVDAMVINFPNRLYGGRARSEPVDEIRHEDNLMTPFKLE